MSRGESGKAQAGRGGMPPQEKIETTHFEICSFGLAYCVNGASYLAVLNDKIGQQSKSTCLILKSYHLR